MEPSGMEPSRPEESHSEASGPEAQGAAPAWDAPWKRVVVYDPGFIQQFGHHYTYNSLIRDAFAARGVPARFFFTRYLPEDLSAAFPGVSREIVALFYEGLVNNESKMENLRRRARHHAKELGRCAESARGRDCLFLAHTLDPAALLGVALWREALPAPQRPRVALSVMLGMYANEAECRQHLAEATALLAGQGGAILFGACRAIADILAELSGGESRVLPTPLPGALTEILAAARTESAGGEEVPVYGVLGEARIDKNMHILPAAIMRYLAMGGKGNFEISVTPTEERLIDPMVLLHDFSQDRPDRIRLSFDHLSVSEYYRKMAACSALIVPYSYGRLRPSGLVVESAVLGVPVIALRGGMLDEELGGLDNGSLFIAEASAGKLAEALLRFDREYEERGRKAAAAARACAARHGTDALLRVLAGAAT